MCARLTDPVNTRDSLSKKKYVHHCDSLQEMDKRISHSIYLTVVVEIVK